MRNFADELHGTGFPDLEYRFPTGVICQSEIDAAEQKWRWKHYSSRHKQNIKYPDSYYQPINCVPCFTVCLIPVIILALIYFFVPATTENVEFRRNCLMIC